MVGEQPGRVRPVARRLGVPDGLGDRAVAAGELGHEPLGIRVTSQ
jgi:hypothetical protein